MPNQPKPQAQPDALCPMCGSPIAKSKLGQEAHHRMAALLKAKVSGQGPRPQGPRR